MTNAEETRHVTVLCVCGHSMNIEYHSIQEPAESEVWFRKYYTKHKCNVCRPRCWFCNRVGDRENMLVVEEKVFCNEWCRDQRTNQTHYSEHNDIPIPGFLAHWSDMSWHNDACARSEYKIGIHYVTIWVETDDPAEREYAPDGKKWAIYLYPDGEEFSGDYELYVGDDDAEAKAWARAAEIVQCGPDADDEPLASEHAARLRQMIAEVEKRKAEE